MTTRRTVLDVTGMSCASCVRHVSGALVSLPGVSHVDVALREGRAQIEHDPAQTSVEQLVAAVVDAGYEAAPSHGES